MVACCFGGGRRFSRHFCIFRKHLKMMPCWSLLVPTRISAWNVVHVCTPTILNCCTWVHVDSLTRTCMPPLLMSFSDSFFFFCDSFIVIHRSLSLCLSVCLSVSLSLCLSVCLSSVSLSLSLSVSLSLCLSLSLSLCVCVCVCVCVFVFVFPTHLWLIEFIFLTGQSIDRLIDL